MYVLRKSPNFIINHMLGTPVPELGVVGLADVATTMKPLELAARFIDEYRRRDASYPDLDQIASSKASEYDCTQDLENAKGVTPFKVSSSLMPSEFFRIMHADALKTPIMGLLTPLKRAYIAIGSKLYIWDYLNGTFLTFTDMTQEILAVDLVPPKRDIFVEKIDHLLVISTPSTMHFYAVSNAHNELSLYDSGITVSISGMGTPLICAHSSGRTFFTASNQGTALYEATYHKNEGWFRSRTSVIDHGGAGFGQSFFGFHSTTAPSEKCVSLVSDESRNLVYSLSNKSTIRIYRVTSDAVSLVVTYSVSHLQQHLNVAASNAAELGQAIKNIKLVSISPLQKVQSQFVPLVAVSQTGLRVFFRSDNFARDPARTFQAVYVKTPPVDGHLGTILPGTSLAEGKLLCAVVEREPQSEHSLFVASIDAARVIHQADSGVLPPFAELSGYVKVQGKVQAIECSTASSQEQCNSLASQYTGRLETIVALTSRALYVLTRRSFYEQLEDVNVPVTTFAQTYGQMEVCCASLALATRPDLHLTRQQKETAISTYLRLGGLPVFKENIEATRKTYILDPKAVVKTNQKQVSIRLSSLFDGLACYTSRLLQNVWIKPLFTYTVAKDGKPINITLTVSQESLERLQSLLGGLSDFLDSNRTFGEGMNSQRPQFSPYVYSGDVSVLKQAEHRSFSAVGRLVKYAKQTSAFLQLIASETACLPKGLDALLSYFDPTLRPKFLDIKFKNFVAGDQPEITRELVTCLINYVIHRGDSVESIAQLIQDRCDSFCTASDIFCYKALEHLHAAKNAPTNDPEQRSRSLYNSVSLFKKAVGSIDFDTLKGIVDEFAALKFFNGAVEVVLAVALDCDKSNLSIGYLKDGKPVGDSREAVYELKKKYFDYIFALLPQVDENSNTGKETYRVLFESRDEVFHFCLYDWFLANGRADKIAHTTSPFVEFYLQAGAQKSVGVAELLWKYHVKQNRLLAAADVLLSLGRGSLDVPMAARVEHLSRAMGYCNCSYPPELREQVDKLSSMVRAYIQIAFAQSDILEAVKSDPLLDDATRQEAIKTLNSRLLSMSELFNDFADRFGYYEICLSIFDASDFRDAVEIGQCWSNLLAKARLTAEREGANTEAYVANVIERLATRFTNSSVIMPSEYIKELAETQSLVKYGRA